MQRSLCSGGTRGLALFGLGFALVGACSSDPGPLPDERQAASGGTFEPGSCGAAGSEHAEELGGAAGQGGDSGGASERAGREGAEGGAGAGDAPSDGGQAGASDAPSEGGGAGASAAPPAPYPRPTYQWLSETGYWSELDAHVLADDLEPFEPNYKLWSDGADKRRWIALPPGTQIDTSDMDHWEFPVGTRLWKEFSLEGVPIETRLIERYGEGPKDYWLGAFVWKGDGSDAEFTLEGEENALATEHDVPAQEKCGSCHNGDAGKVLGFSALQLAGPRDNGLSLAEISARGWLSVEPSLPLSYSVPGDETTASALGYLHANCGNCHNPRGLAWSDTQMVLRLSVFESTPEETELYATVVGQKVQYTRNVDVPDRVLPGDPLGSALLVRMQDRGSRKEMPPLGTERVDEEGVELVRAWIESLSVP